METTNRRTFQIRAAASGELRASFSSESPVLRDWGWEVLEHTADAIDLSRASNGLPLLFGHDHRQLIGRVTDIKLAGRRLRGRFKFGNTEEAKARAADVADGVLVDSSLAYEILSYEQRGQKDGVPVFHATRWMPFEFSLVSVPADASVGINRNKELNMSDEFDTADNDGDTTTLSRSQRRAIKASAELEARAQAARAADAEQIRHLGERFGLESLADDHVALGTSLRDFQAVLRTELQARLRPVGEGQPMQTRGDISAPFARHVRGLEAFGADDSNTRERSRLAFESGMWLRGVLLKDSRAMTWLRANASTRAMSTGVLGAGGALVPDVLSEAIIRNAETFGLARRICQVQPMSSDTLTIPRRAEGLEGHFVGENAAIPEDETAWNQVNLVARKLAVLTRMSSELQEDAIVDLGSQTAFEMGEAFGKKEDQCLFDGDGTSTYGGIYGIRPKIISGDYTAGAIDAASGHDSFPDIDSDDLNLLMAALPLYATPGGIWVCSKAAKVAVFDALADAAGGNTTAILAESPRAFYKGHEILMSQAMPASLTADYSNVAMLLHGDFRRGVVFGDRRMITVKIDESRYLEYDQVAIRATERFDIVVHGLGSATEAGPIVALIGE